MQEFSLDGNDFIELKNLLKVAGLCDNGGHAKAMIAEGEVLVDGEIETRKSKKIAAGQIVSFAGEDIKVVE
jgi:ribosome-associated protein